MTSEVRVEELWTFPLKSGQGVQVTEAVLTGCGLKDDRRFALAGPDGEFVSLRTCPELVHLQCVPTGSGWALSWDSVPGPSLQFPRKFSDRLSLTLWGDVIDVGVFDSEVNHWVSEKAERDLRLVAFDRVSARQVDLDYAPPGTSTMLSDGFPILLTTFESHRQLNQWAGVSLYSGRMRSNLVVSGGAPFEEDSWLRLEGPEVTIELVKPCARCVATTVDPKTGQKGAEPLRTLSVHRKVGNEVIFGQNAIVVREGIVRVGEVLTIVTRR